MKDIFLIKMLKSHYCKIVFLLIFFLSYKLLPEKVFFGWYRLLALAFMISFSLSFTCLIRSIKDRIVLQKKIRHSIFSALAGIIGLSAFQVCGIGAPVCGISIGAAIVSSVFPSFAFEFLSDYAIYLIYISIVLQLYSLLSMSCFVKVKEEEKCD